LLGVPALTGGIPVAIYLFWLTVIFVILGRLCFEAVVVPSSTIFFSHGWKPASEGEAGFLF